MNARGEAAEALAPYRLVLRLRLEAVRVFTHDARLERNRHKLSAACFHAAGLRIFTNETLNALVAIQTSRPANRKGNG